MKERIGDWWVDNVRGGRPFGMSYTDYYGPRMIPLPLLLGIGFVSGVVAYLVAR